MRVETTPEPPALGEVDLLCVALAEGESLPAELAELPGASDVSTAPGETTLLRDSSGNRALIVGLGDAGAVDTESLRVAAAVTAKQAKRFEARSLGWDLTGAEGAARGVVEGTILGTYTFDRLKSGSERQEPSPLPETLRLGGELDPGTVERARVAAGAANRARDLQNLPANLATPQALADRALEIASEHPELEVEVMGPDRLEKLGAGGLLSVGAGSVMDPLLIVLRRPGPGETLALAGKAVTFDTGGISLKRSGTMYEMKMDMSGGAAVLEATAAICESEIDIDLLAAVPAVENMPSGSATRPGDVITMMCGKTVEVNNTDAEGRLILGDALTWCARQGAARMIDVATLTGAVTRALGSTHAAVIGDDRELVETLLEAGSATGELLWELPRHPEYRKLMDGTVADLTNSAPQPKAGAITAAEFLSEFTEGVPWAHLDIAGCAWDTGREYSAKGPTGFGVRLLVELAHRLKKSA